MAYTEADLIAVRRAIKSGARSVQIADRMTTFRSLDELERMERAIAGDLVTTPRPRQFRVVPEKGF